MKIPHVRQAFLEAFQDSRSELARMQMEPRRSQPSGHVKMLSVLSNWDWKASMEIVRRALLEESLPQGNP